MIHITRKRAFVCIGAAITLIAVSFGQPKAETASFYGDELAGSPTASGEPFDPNALTAAHKTLPLGTVLTVCKDRCTKVRINDRGPFIAGRDIDLSRAAATRIGLDGVGGVQVSRVDSPTTEAPEAPKELPRTGGIGQ